MREGSFMCEVDVCTTCNDSIADIKKEIGDIENSMDSYCVMMGYIFHVAMVLSGILCTGRNTEVVGFTT